MLLGLREEWGKEATTIAILLLLGFDISWLQGLGYLLQKVLCLPWVSVVMGGRCVSKLLIRAPLIQTVESLAADGVAPLSWLISPAVAPILTLSYHSVDVKLVLTCSGSFLRVFSVYDLHPLAYIILTHILLYWIWRLLPRDDRSTLLEDALSLLAHWLLMVFMVIVRDNHPCFAYVLFIDRLTS